MNPPNIPQTAAANGPMTRRAASLISRALQEVPCTIITGPRQIGKTTLARHIAAQQPGSLYLDCERPSDMTRLSDPELFLSTRNDGLVVLDEVQRAKGLFPVLRALIDDDRRPGRFLLLGSASPDLIGLSAESLAGRARVVEMSGFDLSEIAADTSNTVKLWVRGGFPLSYLAASDADSFQWREDFIRMFLERDLPQLGVAVPAAQLRRFWTMLAHHHGQIWNASQFAQAFGMSSMSMQRYLGILESAGVIRVVSPFAANLKKRLVKSPRTYIRDTGLLHALLGLATYEDLLGSPIAGASWEGFVVEQIASFAPSGARIAFFRTSAGAELDLVVDKADRRFAFEIKLSTAPSMSKGFWLAQADIKPEHTFVVAPVSSSYPIGANTTVIGPARIAELFAR
jgi:uncharacterized protein